MKKIIITLALVVCFSSSTSFALSERSDHKFGFHIGLIGDPFPTLIGINLNYNIIDFVRITAGYGTISATRQGAELSATTIGGGVRLFVPGLSFSPTVGINWASVSMTATGNTSGLDVGGFTANRDGSHVYASFGLDWQTGLGLNLGVGYNHSFLEGVGGLPYFNIGWYF